MMEVNVALMELEFEADAAKFEGVKDQITQIENRLAGDLSALTSSFDKINEVEKENSLKAIKDVYYRNKYLLRIKESIGKMNK